MGLNIFSAISLVSAIAAAVPRLDGALAALSNDKDLQSALASAPLTSAKIAALSAEWRTVEGDVTAVERDKNFLSKINAAQHLIKDAGLLKSDAASLQGDGGIMAEVAESPIIQARIRAVSAAWDAVHAALSAF